MRGGTPYLRWLSAAFSLVALCFLGATAFSEIEAREISAISESLSTNAMPSIEHLAMARAELRQVESLVDEYATTRDTASEALLSSILRAQARFHLEVDAYLVLPTYPGEDLARQQLRAAVAEVDAAFVTIRALMETGDHDRASPSFVRFSAACERATSVLLDDIRLNAEHGAAMGKQISTARRRSRLAALGFDTVSVAMTILIAVLLMRSVRGYTRLLQEHNELLALRADELEQFAGRVAHDIRNPIGAAVLSIGSLQRRTMGDEKSQRFATRALSSLARASGILDGLLDFALAAARPSPEASALPAAAIREVMEDFTTAAAEQHIELRCAPLPEVALRCHPSILEVLVSNLVRNAIKYMGDGPDRRIVVRARDLGDAVRFEVEDTGVGVPESLHEAIFKPFVRGPVQDQQGVGLGLATVRRICDAHGGRAGVDPVAGRGSLFWFELPKAKPEAASGNGRP